VHPGKTEPPPVEPPELKSFRTLSETLTRIYGHPNLTWNTERDLCALQQTGSVAMYVVKFEQLTLYVNHNDSLLMDQFLYGLKEDIKDEVAQVGYFDTLIELQHFAVCLDSRLYDRQQQQ
jgi:Retrotransposon gag protein